MHEGFWGSRVGESGDLRFGFEAFGAERLAGFRVEGSGGTPFKRHFGSWILFRPAHNVFPTVSEALSINAV